MKIAITGERGFIGDNLGRLIQASDHEFVSLMDDEDLAVRRHKTNEPCVWGNTEDVWASVLSNRGIDVIVHNAAVVGTDVVALNAEDSSLSNVMGTHNIARAARKANVPVCYMGTTVIYDTEKYQDRPIFEDSDLNPRTFYGVQKLAGEQIVRSTARDWVIMRPLFAYGGVGDMNSLIAKTIYSALNGVDSLDMFLNPSKTKDYMHVSDFCNAVFMSCVKGMFGDDYNVAAETPYNTGGIVEMLSNIVGRDVSSMIKWHPETDYLGNHVLSSAKFREASGWRPYITLESGISSSLRTITSDSGAYDPLIHLNDAKEKGVDLTDYY